MVVSNCLYDGTPLSVGAHPPLTMMTVEAQSLTPEEKVGVAISMIDACARICVDSIRDTDPDMPEEELLERARFRIRRMENQHYEV